MFIRMIPIKYTMHLMTTKHIRGYFIRFLTLYHRLYIDDISDEQGIRISSPVTEHEVKVGNKPGPVLTDRSLN